MLLKQPIADAIYYKNHDVIKLLEKRGAKPVVRFEFVKCSLFSDLGLFDLNVLCLLYVQMAPMHVRYAREVPEYEIDPKELDFTNSVEITKVTFTCSFLQILVFGIAISCSGTSLNRYCILL